MLFFNTGVPV